MAEDTDYSITHTHVDFDWKIKLFSDIPKDVNYCVTSPTFPLSHSKWCLWVYPNGQLFTNSAGWIGLYLHKDEADEDCIFAVKMGIYRADGSEFLTWNLKSSFSRKTGVGCPTLIERIRLTAAKSIFAADGSLKFFCSVRIDNSNNSKEKGSQTTFPYADYTLVEDLNRLYLEKQNNDITIKVKDKCVVAHKCILAARSSVFAAMFSHNMAENISGEVEIGDCDLNTVENFIIHLYTGRLDMVSSNNALNLYRIAHMYDVKDLKEECVRNMMRHLSVDSFCDAMYLAMLHNEPDLLTAACTFFCIHKKEILRTPKWLELSSENPITKKLLSAFQRKRKKQLALLQAGVKS